jgi:hypothetical protein
MVYCLISRPECIPGQQEGRQKAVIPNGSEIMSGTGWVITMSIIYLVLVFTLALLTFRKGHWVLGLIGIVFPVLWLIGAILPSRRGYR